MSGYVMCYVAHEAVLGLTDLKCYTVLPDSLVYACLCYFHLLPCFLAGALSLYCIVGMPIKGYYGLKCGIHPVCRHSVLGRFTWPWCLTLCKSDKDCRTSWHLYKHFKTADVWRMGSILALESCICGRIDASRASILAASMWNFSDRFAGNDGQTWSTMKKCGKTAILKRVKTTLCNLFCAPTRFFV